MLSKGLLNNPLDVEVRQQPPGRDLSLSGPSPQVARPPISTTFNHVQMNLAFLLPRSLVIGDGGARRGMIGRHCGHIGGYRVRLPREIDFADFREADSGIGRDKRHVRDLLAWAYKG